MKVPLAYSALLASLFIIESYFYEIKHFLIPLVFVVLSFIFSEKINFYMRGNDLFFGIKISLLILLPPFILAVLYLKQISYISLNFLFYQLFAVALPEELFFRGLIQHSLGNSLKAVVITSLLFSLAHLNHVISNGNFFALLVFFPSIVMGWIYMKRLNILPSVVFHFLSNISYSLVFAQIMLK